MIFIAAFNHSVSTTEDQKELFDKYTKRLQVVREIKERQSIEFQGVSEFYSRKRLFICLLQCVTFPKVITPFVDVFFSREWPGTR